MRLYSYSRYPDYAHTATKRYMPRKLPIPNLENYRIEKRRTNPFKLLAILYFAQHPFLVPLPGSRLHITSVGLLSTLMAWPSERTHLYLRWLEKNNYISNLVRSGGNGRTVECTLHVPPNLSPRTTPEQEIATDGL